MIVAVGAAQWTPVQAHMEDGKPIIGFRVWGNKPARD